MPPTCRIQKNIHIKSICILDCIFLHQQQQCNILLTRSVVCGWLARLRKMTQQKSHCDDFQDSCHRIGLWRKKPYLLDVSVAKNFGIDDTLWYGRYHMNHMIWSISFLSRKIIQNSCWSMLFTYSLGSRIGFCKFLILLATIVNSIVIGVSFDQSSADYRSPNIERDFGTHILWC